MINSFKTGHAPVPSSLLATALRWLIAFAVIILCLLPAYRFAGVGMCFFDEPYQILNCHDYVNVPLAPLSAYIGGVYGNIFGWNWLYFRYFAIGCTSISIIIGCTWMWRRTHAFVPTLLVNAVCLLPATTMRIPTVLFGWDNLTLLSMTSLMVTTMSVIEKPTWGKIVVLSALSAISLWIRLPNIVIILIVAVALYFTPGEKIARLKRLIVYIVATVSLSALILLLLYGSFNAYISALITNAIEEHSKFVLILSLFNSLLQVAFVSLSFLGVHIALSVGEDNKMPRVICIGIVTFILLYALYSSGIAVLMFECGFTMMLIGIACYFSVKSGRRDIALKIALLFCIALVPCIGSNTGLSKMIVFPLLPIITAYIYHIKVPGIRSTAVSCACAFILFLPFAIRRGNAMFDGVGLATETVTKGLLEGMTTSPDDNAMLTAVQKNMKPYTQGDAKPLVLRAGTDYIYEYLFSCPNEYLRHKFDSDHHAASRDYIDWVSRKVADNEYSAVLFFPAKNGESEQLQQMLDTTLRKAAVEPNYIIYTH